MATRYAQAEMSIVWKFLMLYCLLARMDEYQCTKINVLLLYRSNRIDKCASVGTNSDPKRKEKVS